MTFGTWEWRLGLFRRRNAAAGRNERTQKGREAEEGSIAIHTHGNEHRNTLPRVLNNNISNNSRTINKLFARCYKTDKNVFQHVLWILWRATLNPVHCPWEDIAGLHRMVTECPDQWASCLPFLAMDSSCSVVEAVIHSTVCPGDFSTGTNLTAVVALEACSRATAGVLQA